MGRRQTATMRLNKATSWSGRHFAAFDASNNTAPEEFSLPSLGNEIPQVSFPLAQARRSLTRKVEEYSRCPEDQLV